MCYAFLAFSGMRKLASRVGRAIVPASRARGIARSFASMKAIQIDAVGGPDALVFREVPAPSASPGHVVVRNEWIGVNFIDT
jgi:hypothetical protein